MKKIILTGMTLLTTIFGQDMSLIPAKLETGYYINSNIIGGTDYPIILSFKLRGQNCKAFGKGTSTASMIKINRSIIKLTNGYCKKNKFEFEGYFYDKNKMFGAAGERTDNVLSIYPQKGYFSIKNIRKKENKKKNNFKGLIN